MPPAIGALLVAAAPSVFGATLVGSVTVGAAAGYLIAGGAMIGLQMLFAGGGKKSTQSSQVTAKDPSPRRIGGYGRAKLGGSTVVLEAINGAYLYTGTAHCEGPIDGFEEWWLDGTLTGLGPDGGSNPTLPWVGYVTIEPHPGTADQASSPILGGKLGWWTADHRLRGLAWSLQTCILPPKSDKNFQKFFPTGAPTVRTVARLWRVLDPRLGTWDTPGAIGWSRNPAACILDYLTRERVDAVTGKAWRFMPRSRANLASFAAFATLCDQLVPLKGGGDEPRYCLSGTFNLAEEPRDVLRRMLNTCDAELVWLPDTATVGIKGGRFEPPTVTLTDAHVLRLRYQEGSARQRSFNQLPWTFTDPNNDWQTIAGDPWDNKDAQQVDGEVLRSREPLDLTWVNSHPQGRRLAKIRTAKANPRHRITNLVCTLPALALLGERTVRVQIAYLELDAVFTIDRFEPAADLSGATLDLSSIEDSAYAWDPATEEGTPPAVVSQTTSNTNVPTAQAVTLDPVLQIVSGSIAVVRGRATAQPQTGEFAGLWVLLGRYREVGNADWSDMVSDGSAAVITDVLTDGRSYEVEVAWAGAGQESEWVAAGTLKAVADTTPPPAPTYLSALGDSGQVSIAFQSPNASNVATVRVLRASGTVATVSDASLARAVQVSPNQAFDFRDLGLQPGPYRYWAVALNASGVASELAGPSDATVS